MAPLLGRPIDVDEVIRNAIERHTDIDPLRKQIENTDTNARLLANRRLPDLSLYVDYAVAVSAAGASSADPRSRGRSSESRIALERSQGGIPRCVRRLRIPEQIDS